MPFKTKYYEKKQESKKVTSGHGHWSYPLLGEENGCTNECMTGLSYYTSPTYTPPAVHPYQEGFCVFSGVGTACVNGEEFMLEPEVSFLVPAGMEHAIKTDDSQKPLVLFWFHAQS